MLPSLCFDIFSSEKTKWNAAGGESVAYSEMGKRRFGIGTLPSGDLIIHQDLCAGDIPVIAFRCDECGSGRIFGEFHPFIDTKIKQES